MDVDDDVEVGGVRPQEAHPLPVDGESPAAPHDVDPAVPVVGATALEERREEGDLVPALGEDLSRPFDEDLGAAGFGVLLVAPGEIQNPHGRADAPGRVPAHKTNSIRCAWPGCARSTGG